MPKLNKYVSYDRIRVAIPNLKYAKSSSNYYVIMMVQKILNRKFPIFFAFPSKRKHIPRSGGCLCETRREATYQYTLYIYTYTLIAF